MDHDEEERIQYKNITKAETVTVPSSPSKLGLFTVTGAVIVLASVACEIGKQVSNYAINYYNGGTYPLPQTLLVVLLEVLKLSGTVLRMRCQTPSFDKSSVKASFKFLLPSVIYAVNNNIYLGKFIPATHNILSTDNLFISSWLDSSAASYLGDPLQL